MQIPYNPAKDRTLDGVISAIHYILARLTEDP